MSVEEVCSVRQLAPVFGEARAEDVRRFVVDDYLPSASSLPPVRAQLQRGAGQGLLLTMPHTQASDGATIVLGVFIPPAFPQRPPQMAVLLAPGQSIVAGHPAVAPNGAVVSRLLDCGPNPRCLFDIFVSMIMLATSAPPVVMKMPPPGPATRPPPQQAPQQPSAPAPAPPPQAPAQPSSGDIEVDRARAAAAEALLVEASRLADDFLNKRTTIVGATAAVTQRTAQLRAEETALAEEEAALTALDTELAQAAADLAAFEKGGGPPIASVTAADCVEAADELQGQALALLAAVHAHEAQLGALERRHARGALGTDEYLRCVSAVARQEFHARFLYTKAMARVQAPQTTDALRRRFGGQMDEALISSVLAGSDFNMQRAARTLEEMCA